MNSLAQSVSSLSLDQGANRKHKRPHRAFHTFNEPPAMASGGGLQAPRSALQAEGAAPLRAGSPVMGAGAGGSSAMAPPARSTHLVPTQRLEDQQQFLTRTFMPDVEAVPPFSTTQFYCGVAGACDPRVLALSAYNIPKTEQLRAVTALPLGLNVQPFAPVVPSDTAVPAVDARAGEGPLRCRRCRVYANPRFRFTSDSHFICNMCQVRTQLPPEEYSPLGPSGERMDLASKAELTHGTVEFLAPELYNVHKGRAAVPLHYVFLVDISTWANENKSSLAAIEGVRTAINYICEQQPNCKVAIIAYDKWLRFFNLRPESSQAQELIVSELREVFLPLYSGLFVRPAEAMHVIQDTLVKLESFIQDDKLSHGAEACFGSALEAALLALDTATNGNGGKIIATLNTLPTVGNGNLTLRRDDGLKKSLKCDNSFYTALADRMLKAYVGLDLFCTGSAFMDFATLGHPVLATSGTFRHYSNFQLDRDEFPLVNDMLHAVSSTVGYQAQLKVRCSSGLSVSRYYSTACGHSDRDPVIPVVTADQSFTLALQYDSPLQAGTDVYFQASLLYTDLDGVRRVRTSNTSAAVSDNIHEIFKFLNQDVVTALLVQDTLTALGDANFLGVRKSLDTRLAAILTQYRALVDPSHASQLILPDALKSLPAYLLAFQKSPLLRATGSARANDRAVDYLRFATYDLRRLAYRLYPQILPLHVPLSDDDYTFYDAHNLLLQFPSADDLAVRAAHGALADGGCYLIFQGDTVYLWLNDHTHPQLLRDLLAADAPPQLLPSARLPGLDTDISARVRSVLDYWAALAGRRALPVQLLRPHSDPLYARTLSALVTEDASVDGLDSYDAHLVVLHRAIQDNLRHDRYLRPAAARDHDSLAQRYIQF
ncbi:ACR151Wp [Eremothecium gossypii ATCC 10895]|uniref:ACR151Wp n=1 Tax=Eremothecium gossypii (strain ATCC 10895 / CBS 109.51 / FGSC 9923 / NRRL Y-1056) TaxID=284811 RepID=Q75BX0_EREGS|nr:ACR151Wp [Eremothecium gossypii ATCC 10895]AAS51377.2 ACR151Wp [Eremothecium gossypii ATCC 10895]AEY95668.1 FACR151Wp [Eremothecium gossypii FDAG1]